MRVVRRDWVIFLSAAVFGLAVQMAAQRWPETKGSAHSSKDAGSYEVGTTK
jgi:hypothetical protein